MAEYKKEENKKRLIVIDGNAVVHRAFHALPRLTTRSGELVNAIYGFLLVFFKAIKEFKPDFVVATFDMPGPTFRHKKYKEYKAGRKKAPDELYEQIPKIKEILKTFNIQIFEKQGFEADDLIGTISKQSTAETIILTGDLDALQLVDKDTKVYALRKGVKDTVLYDKEKVKEKYDGLSPKQLIDFKALRGDPSDNIPGVPGIGEKTAISLIKKFKTLDNIYDNIKGIDEPIRKKLIEHKDIALISKMLVQIKLDVDIDFDLKKSIWPRYNKDKVIQLFKKYEFKTLENVLEEKQQTGLWG